MKRRVLAVLLAATTMTGLLAGCGSKETASNEVETDNAATATAGESTEAESTGEIGGSITVITNRTDLVDTKLAEYKQRFEEKYPGTEVKFEAITDYEGDMGIRMQTEEYGDVLSIPEYLAIGDLGNYFEPLGMPQDLSDKYEDIYLFKKYHNGQVYGLASTVNVQGIVYNKKVFADAGITELPKSPEEFLEALRSIKENTDAIPYYTNFHAGWTLTQWQDHCWGAVSGDPEYRFNIMPVEKEPFSEGKPNYIVMKLLYDIVKEGLCEEDPVTSDWEQSKVMLNNGEIGAMTLGLWSVTQMQAAGPNAEDIGYMPFPYNIDGVQYATAGPDYCFGINVHSKNKATARAWIDFVIDETDFAVSEGGVSIVKGAALPETLAAFEGVEMITDNPAVLEKEGLLDQLSNDSEIGLYAEPEKVRLVEAAMGTRDESFEEIMDDWNTRWTQAQEDNDVAVEY